ncbi:MAG: crossover junction endodeoxyribonuclease RuvC [Candidatus Brennerbacteria bacterium]|nr:crossover junction endodeoxyribonuclease RuvC [Candidatus Brennerbacteria bacterium]
MKIAGIDPGIARIGYAVVVAEGNSLRPETFGTWEIPSAKNTDRLVVLESLMVSFLKKFRPERVGIERLFFSTNQRTAMAVAEARGVILLATAKAGGSIIELTPNQVKQSVAGDGNASKRAVAKMSRWILHLPDASTLDDTTDAIAIAIAASKHVW